MPQTQVLERIKDAEREADEIVEQAREEAEERVEAARAEADEIRETAREEAQTAAEQRLAVLDGRIEGKPLLDGRLCLEVRPGLCHADHLHVRLLADGVGDALADGAVAVDAHADHWSGLR